MKRWVGYAIQSVLSNLNKPEIIIIDDNSGRDFRNSKIIYTGQILGDKKIKIIRIKIIKLTIIHQVER